MDDDFRWTFVVRDVEESTNNSLKVSSQEKLSTIFGAIKVHFLQS